MATGCPAGRRLAELHELAGHHVTSDDPEELLAHPFHLVHTSVRICVLLFDWLVSIPSLPTDSFTSVMRRYLLAFDCLVCPPSLPTDPFTSVGRRYVFLFDWLISSPSLPAYPFT
jgi:hypothetical protein